MKICRLLSVSVLLLPFLHGCASIDVDRAAKRSESQAISQDTPGQLQKLAHKPGPSHPKESGFVLLDSGLVALAARLWLAEKAEKTLDVQYYIFHGDKTGALVAEALLNAAERGVRVRVLLDDINAQKNEAGILALDSHPNIEIRLFNPFYYRTDNPLFKLGQWLHDDRLNRRMHNKLFVADNQFAITGGRNVGDEYFLAHDDIEFLDLDVMASGPVVADLSASFDSYWASGAATPARALPGYKEARSRLPELKAALKTHREALAQTDYGQQLRSLRFEALLLQGKLPAYTGTASVIADPPEKVEGNSHISDLLVGQLTGLGLNAQKELIVVSPYFVPGKTGSDWFAYLRSRGAKVRVLTNSMAASDVPVVHSGYARYRRELLGMGVELHEVKPRPNASPKKTRIVGSGSSRTSLHAKVLIFDREHVFIGSFNFDPRSALLNSELGLVIHSSAAAEKLAGMADKGMDPVNSYVLSLETRGDETAIIWTGLTARGETATDTEPNSTWWERFKLQLLMGLPIEQHL